MGFTKLVSKLVRNITATAGEINILDGVTSSTSELNILDGVTADSTDLNRTDVTTEGTAEASKVLTSDANKATDMDGGRFNNLQNLSNLSAKGPGYWLNGTSDYLEVADDDNIDVGKQDFSLFLKFRPDDVSGTQYLLQKETGGVGYGLYMTDDDLYIRFDDGTTDVSAIIGTAVFEAEENYDVAVTFDRDGDATAYVNHIQVGTVDISSASLTLSNAGVLRLGSTTAGGSYLQGAIYSWAVGNKVFTEAEVNEMLERGTPYKYQGARQTSIVTGDDSDMDTQGNWSGGGSATLTGGYNSGDAGHTTTLRIESGDGVNERAELAQANFSTTAIPGKMYRLTFDYKWINSVSVEVGGFVSLGGTNFAVTSIGAGWQAYSDEAIVIDNSTPLRIYSDDGSGSVNNELLIDNVTLTQVGVDSEHTQDGVGHNQWSDVSGNELHGAVTGATPFGLSPTHKEIYMETVTGDTSFTVPAGYRIAFGTFEETAGNALTGGMDMGTTNGGVEVVNGETIGASAKGEFTFVKQFFDHDSDTTVYITDGDDDANWNSASVEVRIRLERIA